MEITRRAFLVSVGRTAAGGAALLAMAGCVAPRLSPTLAESSAQPWRCAHCGYLTRSDQDLTDTRCPRCRRKGFMQRISEEALQRYLHRASHPPKSACCSPGESGAGGHD